MAQFTTKIPRFESGNYDKFNETTLCRLAILIARKIPPQAPQNGTGRSSPSPIFAPEGYSVALKVTSSLSAVLEVKAT